MNASWLRLAFVGFWLIVAGMVAGRHWIMPEQAARGSDRQMDLIAMISVGLAAWNFFRWYAARQPRAGSPQTRWPEGRRPLEPRPQGERAEEYNPDLDFSRKPDEPTG